MRGVKLYLVKIAKRASANAEMLLILRRVKVADEDLPSSAEVPCVVVVKEYMVYLCDGSIDKNIIYRAAAIKVLGRR
jgi:hypothetical protein